MGPPFQNRNTRKQNFIYSEDYFFHYSKLSKGRKISIADFTGASLTARGGLVIQALGQCSLDSSEIFLTSHASF